MSAGRTCLLQMGQSTTAAADWPAGRENIVWGEEMYQRLKAGVESV